MSRRSSKRHQCLCSHIARQARGTNVHASGIGLVRAVTIFRAIPGIEDMGPSRLRGAVRCGPPPHRVRGRDGWKPRVLDIPPARTSARPFALPSPPSPLRVRPRGGLLRRTPATRPAPSRSRERVVAGARVHTTHPRPGARGSTWLCLGLDIRGGAVVGLAAGAAVGLVELIAADAQAHGDLDDVSVAVAAVESAQRSARPASPVIVPDATSRFGCQC